MPSQSPTPLPLEASIIVTAPTLIEVSEDGSQTSSFAISLGAEPLSTVTVQFQATYGGALFHPPTVVFTYSNYSRNVSIDVAGVDDNIDQGTSHGDKIRMSLFTEDALSNCVELGRSECKHMANYAILNLPELNISIIDDDEAGLVFSTTAVSASYDNYGDSLSPGLYSVKLASQPQSEVFVNLSGLDSYSTLSSNVLSFLPSSWNISKSIFVSAAAQISNRPVCSIADRFCEELDGRVENITHVVTSSDALYHNLAAASVELFASVVYDAQNPPTVATAAFSDLLSSFTVHFNTSTNRAGLSGNFDCALNILNLTVSQATELLGSNSYCTFVSDDTLKVTFGAFPTLLPGAHLMIRDQVLKNSLSSASLFTMSASFVVAQPALPTVPRAVLSASSSLVGLCDDLSLDGSATTGSGGRDLSYHFSVVPASSEGFFKNISRALDVANALNAGAGTFKVVIDSAAMLPNSKFKVQVNVSNFLGQHDVASVFVKKLAVPAPALKIQGVSPLRVTRSSSISLKASATLPSMRCMSQSLSSSKMSFKWFEDTGTYTGALSGTSNSPRTLNIAASTLDPLHNYTFRVIGFMVDTPMINNSASLVVEVVEQDLVATISGGNYRQFSSNASFVLDGGESYDPDNSSAVFSYSWSSDSEAVTSLSTSSSSLAVPANTLSPGTYIFTMLVARGSRHDSATTTVEIVSGFPPVISINSISDTKFNTDDGYLSVTGTVSSSHGFTSMWFMEDSDIESPFITKNAAAAVVSNSLRVLVSLSSLTAGNTYTLSLYAEDTEKLSSFSTITLNMNEAPSGGGIIASPKKGFALVTPFALSAVNWVDEDLPLSYLFGTAAVVTSTGIIDTCDRSPFGGDQVDSSLNNVALPQGAQEANYTVGCFAAAIDTFGASGLSTSAVQVFHKSFTFVQLFNISEELATKAIESADADAAKRVLSASMAGLSTARDDSSSRRRTMLGSSTSAAEIREYAMESLWSTYTITPLTQLDVASLLSVLSGIVEIPSEVSVAAGKSALHFETTILQASFAAEIGISAESVGFVGEALSLLFDTTIFNSSYPSSLGYFDNVTKILDIVSTLQLYGADDGLGYPLSATGVDLFSYRHSGSLANLGALSLSLGGSGDATTSVSFNVSTSDISPNIDVRLFTLNANPYEHILQGTAGSAAAAASRADQVEKSGFTLLRSKVTVLRLALENEVAAINWILPEDSVSLTLAATVPFDTNNSNYLIEMACVEHDAELTLACPLSDVNYVCDLDSNSQGSSYSFVYYCPRVVPTCLWWNEATLDFSDDGCTAMPGYSSDAVTCKCDRLASFVLGANVTAPALDITITDMPTVTPTPPPTSLPTTKAPTLVPTTADTVSASVSLEVVATAAPTDADVVAFRTTIADTLDVAERGVRNLILLTVATSRRALLADSYTWSVSFDVSASLTSTSATDASTFAATVESQLNTAAFATALAAAATSVTSVGDATADAIQPSPTSMPTLGGTTSAPPSTSNSTSTSASMTTELILLCLGAGLIAVLAGVAIQVRRAQVHNAYAKNKVVPAVASPSDSSVPAPDGRIRLDPLTDGGGSVLNFVEETKLRGPEMGADPTQGSPLTPAPFQLIPRVPQVSPISYHDLVRAGRPIPTASSAATAAPLRLTEAGEASEPRGRLEGRVRLRPLALPGAAGPTNRAELSLFPEKASRPNPAAAPRLRGGWRVAPSPLPQIGSGNAAASAPSLIGDQGSNAVSQEARSLTRPNGGQIRSGHLSVSPVSAASGGQALVLESAHDELEALSDQQAALEAQTWGVKVEMRRANLLRARLEAARMQHEVDLLRELDRQSRALAVKRARAEHRRARAVTELKHSLNRELSPGAEIYSNTEAGVPGDIAGRNSLLAITSSPDGSRSDMGAAQGANNGLPRRLEPLVDPHPSSKEERSPQSAARLRADPQRYH